jgi:hypothetical protein
MQPASDGMPANDNRASAPAPAITGPVPIKDFLDSGGLRCADVLLSRNEWNLMSWLIRTATDANFAHAALVFLRPESGEGWRSTYVIESVFSGVEVTDIHDYFKHPRLSVAIKRLNRDWFEEAMQRRVRGRMLDDIKAEYDFTTMFRLGRQALFGMQRMMLGHKRAVMRREAKGLDAPKEFICSGFMQRGYANAFVEFARYGHVPAAGFRDIIFDAEVAKHLPVGGLAALDADRDRIFADFVARHERELLAVTPRDIELHEAFDWTYVLTGGKAHPVTGYAEVCELLKCKPVVK